MCVGGSYTGNCTQPLSLSPRTSSVSCGYHFARAQVFGEKEISQPRSAPPSVAWNIQGGTLWPSGVDVGSAYFTRPEPIRKQNRWKPFCFRIGSGRVKY